MSSDFLSDKKTLTPAADILRGDIILFKTLGTGETKRGIVYSQIPNANGRTIGLLVLPLETVGKKKSADTGGYPAKEITDYEVTRQAGANPGMHKCVAVFNLRTVVIDPRMTGSSEQGKIYKVGTCHGLPFMTKLLGEAHWLYANNGLFKDGKRVTTQEHQVVQDPRLGQSDTRAVRTAHAIAHRKLAEEDIESRKVPMAAKMPKPEAARKPKADVAPKPEKIAAIVPDAGAMSLREAFDKGHIAGRTVLTFLHYSLQREDKYFPETLRDALTLATNEAASIKSLTGVLLEKKDPQNAIADIKAAARTLHIK